MVEEKKEVDIYRDTPVRLLGECVLKLLGCNVTYKY